MPRLKPDQDQTEPASKSTRMALLAAREHGCARCTTQRGAVGLHLRRIFAHPPRKFFDSLVKLPPSDPPDARGSRRWPRYAHSLLQPLGLCCQFALLLPHHQRKNAFGSSSVTTLKWVSSGTVALSFALDKTVMRPSEGVTDFGHLHLVKDRIGHFDRIHYWRYFDCYFPLNP